MENLTNAIHVLYRDDFRSDELFNSILEDHGIERPCEVSTLTINAIVVTIDTD